MIPSQASIGKGGKENATWLGGLFQRGKRDN